MRISSRSLDLGLWFALTLVAFSSVAGTIPPEAVDPAEQLNSTATLDERHLPAATTGTEFLDNPLRVGPSWFVAYRSGSGKVG